MRMVWRNRPRRLANTYAAEHQPRILSQSVTSLSTPPYPALACHLVHQRRDHVADLLGVSRTTTYRLVRDKKLELVKVGRRPSAITMESLEKHLGNQLPQNEE